MLFEGYLPYKLRHHSILKHNVCMQNKVLLLLAGMIFFHFASAQEKLLYSTNFQEWTAVAASATPQTVNKTTDFSLETLTFKFFQVAVNPAGWDATRFVNPPATPGYAQAQKVAGSYIELSPLQSITKVSFTEGATGGNRGYKVWKKNATDAAWVLLYSTAATPSSGQTVVVNVNESNVAVKFTNIDDAQNAYMFDLNIYGNFVPVNPQVALNTSMNLPGAGTITRTPNSDTYDQGTTVSLQASTNFGYKFIKWTDSLNNDLSTANPYSFAMTAATHVRAVFQAVNTYTFNVNIAGSNWGEVQLSPLPTGGKYEEGTVVSMKVIPNPVTNFSYWEDNSTLLDRTVTVTGNMSFTATFDEVPFIVGWNFKAQTPTSNRTGDFYSESSNVGLISSYEPGGTSVGWLANQGSFSPILPNIRLWTPGAEFKTRRRYIKANFATTGYKNIRVKSLISANYQAYSKQLIQYSLDDVTYVTVDTADITSVYNSAWKQTNTLLPAAAEGVNKIYVRWLADVTSPILSEGTDNDGTAFTNIFIYADKNTAADSIAPTLIATVPTDGSNTASINGSIVLTFTEGVKAGTGNITLNGTVLAPSFGSKTASLVYERLAYNTQYTLEVPAGALTDLAGNVFAGDTITFRTSNRLEPAKKLFDAVVAADGTGNYTSVIDAIAAAPANRAQPWLIYIKNGTYTGHHTIPANKPFIHLIGQARDSVIISDSLLSGGANAVSVSAGATMYVNANDCYFENITLENSYGYKYQAGPQALALYSEANHFTTNNCWLRSYQDTYLTTYNGISNRHYIKNTKIEGAVDYIYGAGDVFFDKCTITNTRKTGGYIVAPSHGNGTLWGYVFSYCTIDEAHTTGATNYFGRAWANAPKTVFLYTTLKSGIYPQGWYYKMGTIPAVFADYGTMDINGNMVDTSQRIEDYEYDVKDANGNVIQTVHGKAKKSLTPAEAATYTYENVVLRSADTWDPRMMTEAPAQPVNVVATNKTITWDSVPYTRLYIIFRNNTVVGFTINTTFTDTTTGTGAYAVQAVSEFGALSTPANASGVLPVTLLDLTASLRTGAVNVAWTTTNETRVDKYGVERSTNGSSFKAIGAVKSNGSRQYNFVDNGIANLQTPVVYYRLKMMDVDGSYQYSKVVKLPLKETGSHLTVAPNPVHDLLNVTIKQNSAAAFSIRVVDATGKQVYQRNFTAGQTNVNTYVNTDGWQNGAYYLQVQSADGTRTTTFIKQ
jgi:pectin methylesterase-like acyl-CoA thioesterase